MTIRLEDILRLSVPERVQLGADIWDSIAASPEALPVTEAQRQELDRRLAALKQAPGTLFSSAERIRMACRLPESESKGRDVEADVGEPSEEV